MSDVRSRFPLHELLSRWDSCETQRRAGRDLSNHRSRTRFRAERLLRWYLLVWVCLVSVLGFAELWNQAVPTGWNVCQTAQVKPEWCEQLKLLLSQGTTPLPGLTLFLNIMFPSIVAFTLLMLLYGTLLWVGLSGKSKRGFSWLSFPLQGLLVLAVGLVVPQVGVTVPLSLYLALILEACAILKRARAVIAVSCGSLILFILTVALLIWQHWDLSFSGDNSFGTIVALILLVVGFLFAVGFLMVYLQLVGVHSEIEAAYAQLEEAHVQLQASAEHIEALTRLTERQRLARELHDTLAQGLVGLSLQLETVDALLTEERARHAQEIVREAMQRARATLATARSAIDDLRSEPTGVRNFPAAVQEEVQRFTTATSIPCLVELDGLSLLPSPLYEHLLRVIGEGLTNIARHAKAHHAEVRIREEHATLTIEVRDDGIGFDSTVSTTQAGHYGLLGLRERARLIGGYLEVQSAPGEGTVLRFSCPHTTKASSLHPVTAVRPASEAMLEEA